MEDLHRKQEQVNTPSDVDFTVEEIMAEFGSAVQTEEELRLAEQAREEAARAADKLDRHGRRLSREDGLAVAEAVRKAEEAMLAAQTAEDEEETVKIWTPRGACRAAEEETAEAAVAPAAEEEVWADVPEEPAEPISVRMLRLLPKVKKPEKREDTPRTPEEAEQFYAARSRRLRLMTVLAWMLMLLSAAVTVVASTARWGLKDYLPAMAANLGTLAVLVAHLGLAADVLIDGIAAVGKGKFTVKTLVVLAALVTLVSSAAALKGDGLCLAPAASLLLTVCLWSESLLARAKLRSFSAALDMDAPTAVTKTENAWEEKACIHRAPADCAGMAEDLEQAPGTEKTANIFAVVLTALSLAVAVVLNVKGGRDLLLSWNILLLGICPAGAVLAYPRAFGLAQRRLKNAGAVILGWGGAKKLTGPAAALVTDGDLFPRASVAMNGIKIFSDQTTERVLGYALAMLERGGAQVLTQLFGQTLEAQNGRKFRVDNFRTYETGGFYGEIQGDVVRLGGVGFMKSVGIPVPEDARKRFALCLSVDGRVAAAFVLSYSPSESGRRGLAGLMGCRGLTPVLATRDMQLSDQMVQAVYRLPADRMEYPSCGQRAELAALSVEGQTGGLLSRNGFLPFVMTVRAARQLRSSVPAATAAALLGAVVGFFLMSLLALIGAFDTASALNLLAYHSIWLIPAAMITGSVGKS